MNSLRHKKEKIIAQLPCLTFVRGWVLADMASSQSLFPRTFFLNIYNYFLAPCLIILMLVQHANDFWFRNILYYIIINTLLLLLTKFQIIVSIYAHECWLIDILKMLKFNVKLTFSMYVYVYVYPCKSIYFFFFLWNS